MCRNLVLVLLLLSVLDHTSSAQSDQEGRFEHLYDSQWKQVTAGFITHGNRYHSDYFDFTYSLPGGFVDETEQFKSRIKALPRSHSDPGRFVLLHAEKRSNESAEPVGAITVTVASLSGYTTEKDFMHRTDKAMAFAGDAVLQEGERVDVSGSNFFRADYKINGDPIGEYLTVMVTFRRDFAIMWQFSSRSKKEVHSITSSMPRNLIIK